MMLLQKFKATKKLKGKVAARKEIEKLFIFLQRTNLYISRHVAESVLSFCGKENAKFSFIYSTNNDFAGKCKNCGGQLPKYNLSDKDRLQLVEILTKFGLTETDIHQNTNPEEFKRFLKFLDKNSDFDLVVDGPNVSYKPVPAHMKTNTFIQGRNLYQTVQHFSDLNWKILVIHKGELKRNPFYSDLCDLE